MGILSSIKLLAFVGLLAGAGYAAKNVTDLKAELAVADANIETLKDAKRAQDAVIDQMREDFAQQQQLAQDLRESLAQREKDLEELNDRFQRSANGNPRDIGNLATARPQSVQRVINAASKTAIRCLELASGSPLTEKEKEVDSRNTECQGLLDSLKLNTDP